jgi:hypothetical protein
MDDDYIEFDLEGLLSLIAKSDKAVQVTHPLKQDKPTITSELKSEPKRPKRCQMAECKQKLALTDSACKCSGFYCMKHRHAETHSCAFDYKGEGMNKLKAQLPEVKGVKVENI